jgi:hypothetical protein
MSSLHDPAQSQIHEPTLSAVGASTTPMPALLPLALVDLALTLVATSGFTLGRRSGARSID